MNESGIEVFESEYSSDSLGRQCATWLSEHPEIEIVKATTRCRICHNPLDGGDRYTLTVIWKLRKPQGEKT